MQLHLLILLAVHFAHFAKSAGTSAWPKLIISNDGKDIRLAEPKSNFTNVETELENSITYQINTLYDYVDYASPFDISVEESKMFFVRHDHARSGDKLVAVDLDRPAGKKNFKVLLRNFSPVSDGIAVDWITKKLYMYEDLTHRIEVLDYGRSIDYTKPLLTVFVYKNVVAHSLVVDPISGYMFWLNSYHGAAIERAGMDGRNKRTLRRFENGHPNALSVDYKEGRLYWTNSTGSIWSSTLDGLDLREIISDLNPGHPYAVAPFENMLLWGDISEPRAENSEPPRPGVYYCNKEFCDQGKLLVKKLKPFTMRIFDQRRQIQRTNPCAINNGNCSYLCLLSPGIHERTCACPVGVRLIDEYTCSDGPEQIIIIALRGSIRVISLDTTDFTDQRVPIDNIKHAVAVDFDSTRGYIYWVDTALEMIRRVKLDGSGESDVVVGISPQAERLAIDWIAQNVYWTDCGAGRIEVARIGVPTARRILLSTDISKPRAIVVDPMRGHLYWTDWDDISPRIEKAFLDGSARSVLVQLNEGEQPNGLALDSLAGHIYWADAEGDVLERANSADGSDRITLMAHTNSHAWGLTAVGDFIYWSDMQHRSLERLPKIGFGTSKTIADHLTDIMGIKGVDLKQQPNDTNDCAINNGGCSHLCLYRPVGMICMCPLGWELAADGRQCLVPHAFLVFTQQKNHDIMIASLSRFPVNLDYMRLHNISQPFSLDYYYKRNYLYWTGSEGDHAVISRACLNGTHIETIVDYGLNMTEALAIDWVAEQLYWSDRGYNHIEVARLDGKSRRIIVWNDVKPGALVVSPRAGYLYWFNWKYPQSIERSELDGKNRAVFLPGIGRVSSLALDETEDGQRLYWANIDAGTITFVDLNDKLQRILRSEKSMQPYGLTLFGDRLYWADWHKQTIETCHKDSCSNQTVLYSNQHLVKSLIAVNAMKQETRGGGCLNGERKCEHLCFARPSSIDGYFQCGCPTHYELNSDLRSCSAPSSFILFVQGSLIRRMQTSESGLEGSIATLPYKGLSNVVSLKYDPINRTIYWMEKINRSVTIKRAFENGRQIETLTMLQNAEPVDFAIDPSMQLIFWTTEHTDGQYMPSIRVNKFVDGALAYLGLLVSQADAHPKWITVDPLRGYLFFVDQFGDRSRIVRCAYDGTACTELVTEDNAEFTLLNIDLEHGVLFWYNRKRRVIARMTNDGNDHTPEFVSNSNGILSLAILKNRLYFVDEKSNIFSVDKTRNSEKKELHVYQKLDGLKSIVAVEETWTKKLQLNDACIYAKCKHICYVDRSSGSDFVAKCGCTIGKKLQRNSMDEQDCIETSPCEASQWQCADGSCISRTSLCDGHPQCPDGGSDEKNCTCNRCESEPSKCIPPHQVCNGVVDCADGSDERRCPPDLRDQWNLRNDYKDITKINSSVNTNRNDGHYKPALDSTLNVVIYVVVSLGFLCIVYAMVRWCRGCRCRKGKRRGNSDATLELRVLAPLNNGANGLNPTTATTTTTTVEYSATCRIIHHPQPSAYSDGYSSIGPLPPPLGSDDRPNLTGKSSSSSDVTSSSAGQRRILMNPPPSPATMVTTTTSSRSPDSAMYNQQYSRNQNGRRRRVQYDDDGTNHSVLVRAPASSMVSHRSFSGPRRRSARNRELYCGHPTCSSPPPPYSDLDNGNDGNFPATVHCVTPLLDSSADGDQRGARVGDTRTVQTDRRRRSNRRRRTSSGNRRRNNGTGSRPLPSSPCSSHRYRYDNPPPTPNGSSASSCGSSMVDGPSARPER